MLDVALLGTGGMMPLANRFLSSMICRFDGRLLLMDCGEGTQVSNRLLGWGFKNIDIICLTHVHGDHVTGLPGMLLTIGNSNRINPIIIVGPKGIKEVVTSLLIVARELAFDVIFHEFTEDEEEITIGDFTIKAKKMDHRIVCYGYSIIIKRVGKFDKDKALENNVPKDIWGMLQKKETIEKNNIIYTPDMVLGEDRKGIKLSYITDTRPVPGVSEFVKDSDLFICEGIYGEDEKIDKAIHHKHMLFSEAATIGKEGNVSEMWLTHFSPALLEPDEFLEVAQNIFPNTKVGEDRMSIRLSF